MQAPNLGGSPTVIALSVIGSLAGAPGCSREGRGLTVASFVLPLGLLLSSGSSPWVVLISP